jgi:protein-tyrosine phosphatase family protein
MSSTSRPTTERSRSSKWPETQNEPRRSSSLVVGGDDLAAAYRIDLEARVATLSVRDQYRTLYLESLDRDAPRFAEALRVVSTASAGTLIHCERGKDRTEASLPLRWRKPA